MKIYIFQDLRRSNHSIKKTGSLLGLILLLGLFACQPAGNESQTLTKDTIPTLKKALPVSDTLEEQEVDYAASLKEQEDYQKPKSIYPQYKNSAPVVEIRWQNIEDGLNWVSLDAPQECNIGDSKITILKVDPEQHQLKLLSVGASNEYQKNAQEWAHDENLIAVFNAGMFQQDGKTSVGYLKNYDYINNPKLASKYKSIFAFNPKSNDVPAAKIIDLDCDKWSDWKDKYHSYVQGIRMISCTKKNVWSRQEKYWSMVSLATDDSGNVLFCFSRTPYAVADFNTMLLKMPLGIQRMMYLEGGPEASFYVDHPSIQLKKMGSYETGFNENDANELFWGIPNVIGVGVK